MSVTFDIDPVTEDIVIGHHQDVSAILEDNKAALIDLDEHKRASKKEWAHYAKIPEIVILEWRAKYGVDFLNPSHFKKCMSLINDPDYKFLKRTSYHHDR